MIELLNCDCMEYMKTVPDKFFDLAIVDPPYGINQDLKQNAVAGTRGHHKTSGRYKEYHETDWDSAIPDDYFFDEVERASKDQIVWGGNYFHTLSFTGVIVWYKGKSIYDNDGEMAKTSLGGFRVFNMSRADAYINQCDNKIHPTQKPVKLYKWLLMNYAKEGDKILDTHLGSGSIAIACHDLKFDLVGCEIDKDYYDAAVKRFENHKKQLTIF